MKNDTSRIIFILTIALASLSAAVGTTFAKQDRFTLKALNGIAFSEFKGYEDWGDVAVSATKDGIKAILANPAMIAAYRSGIPGNGKPFPDGSKIVKIEWSKKQYQSPYFVEVPDTLKSVSFIEKDSKRFPDSSGWGYAQFLYDAPSDTFKAFGTDSSFGKTVCYKCHTSVASRDYIFTSYPPR
jgi:hypothetical protein